MNSRENVKVVFKGPVIVVKNIEKSKKFYTEILGVHVVSDFGENVTFTGNFSINSSKLWADFIDKEEKDISHGGNNFELYFETEDYDVFREKLSNFGKIELLHDTKVFPWQQRSIRFFDLDKHIIEVGESMHSVCSRLLNDGMTEEEVSRITMHPISFVKKCNNL